MIRTNEPHATQIGDAILAGKAGQCADCEVVFSLSELYEHNREDVCGVCLDARLDARDLDAVVEPGLATS